MDLLLQVAKEAKQLEWRTEMETSIDEFKSAYSLDGQPILPPLMTEKKRLEMKLLRLEAMLKSNINAGALGCKPSVTEGLKPLEHKCTNTESTIASLIVMGRFRQKLTQSETLIYDHTNNLVIQVSRPDTTPEVSHLMLEDAPKVLPQRAVIKITPVMMATQKSSWVAVLDVQEKKIIKGCPELIVNKLPLLRRSTTCIDSSKLHHQMWRRNPIESAQNLLEALKTPPKPENPIETTVKPPPKEESKVRPRSRIPLMLRRPKLTVTLPPISPGKAVISEVPHEVAREATREVAGEVTREVSRAVSPEVNTPPPPVRVVSATERRRNYDQKVAALKRIDMAKKREECAARQKPAAKPNLPKSIRTPVAAHQRSGLLGAPPVAPPAAPEPAAPAVTPGESELQLQRNRFQSLVARQADEQQRLQAEFEKQQQMLVYKMLGDLNHVTSETSNNQDNCEASNSSNIATSSSCSYGTANSDS